MSVGVAYGSPKGKAVGQNKEKPAKVEKVEKVEKADKVKSAPGYAKKELRHYLNDEKKEIQNQIKELERLLEEMGLECENTTTEAISLEIESLRLEKKEVIMKRLIAVKTDFTDEELYGTPEEEPLDEAAGEQVLELEDAEEEDAPVFAAALTRIDEIFAGLMDPEADREAPYKAHFFDRMLEKLDEGSEEAQTEDGEDAPAE